MQIYKENYIAAYDLGTNGLKLSLVDTQGRIAQTACAEYPLYVPSEGWAEQEPEDYWQAVCRATKEILSTGTISAQQIIGIIFCTQWKGIIPIGVDGSVLGRSIIWLDQRAQKQADDLNRRMMTKEFCSSDYWPKIMWIKENELEIYRKSKLFLEANGYLKYRLTGNFTCDLTGHFTRSCHTESQSRLNDILDAAEISKDKFPPLVLPHELVGRLTHKSASDTGLLEGTPVFGGCGDIPAIAIGTGATEIGDVHLYLGSSGWFGITGPISGYWHGSRTSAFTHDKNIYLMGLESVGLTVKWLLKTLYSYEREALGDKIYSYLENELQKVPPGSDNLFSIPSLYGENKPFSQKIKGSFINLSSIHDREHMARSMLESICYFLRIYKEDFEACSGKKLEKIRAAGGGSKNKVWMQMMADVLGIPVEIPKEPSFAGTRGSACCAALGLGLCKDLSEYRSSSALERIYMPDPCNLKAYNTCFNKYKKIIHQMIQIQEVL